MKYTVTCPPISYIQLKPCKDTETKQRTKDPCKLYLYIYIYI